MQDHDHDQEDDTHEDRRNARRRTSDHRQINWSAVSVMVAIAIYVVGSLSGWFGANAQEVRRISERLATLESQRAEDVRRAERIERSVERVEDKLDRLLGQMK